MKVTNREKIMLLLLVGIIFLYIYYSFFLIPQLTKLQNLRGESMRYEEKLVEYRNIDTLEKNLNDNIQQLNKKLELYIDNYFLDLQQEEIILLIKDFIETSGLKISSLNFSKPTDETLEQTNINIIEVNIYYEGNYNSLKDLLETLWGFQKKIILKNLSIMSKEEGILTGNISLDFYYISSINNIKNNKLYEWYLYENIKRVSPFEFSDIEENYVYIYKGKNLILED